MTRLLKQLAGDRSGATAIEYGLIAAFIALALVATLPAIKRNLGEVYSDVNKELSKAARQQ
ncbi:Flp family type IVb pilin [Thermaurantiacus sp.]